MEAYPFDTLTDDEIKRWALKNMDIYPVTDVPLNSVRQDAPDVARIHFDKKGQPVERIYSAKPG